ncbi:SNF2 family N-terminal domain-containing protein [Mycena floridula]|nr:SNF2 family N-terminal domain-containing protein [Mycena floridula]
MLDTVVQYTESVRTRSKVGDDYFRPSLNIPALLDLLHSTVVDDDNDDDDNSPVKNKGKKRQLPSKFDTDQRPAKRVKNSVRNDGEDADVSKYPTLHSISHFAKPGAESIHVFRHTFDIQYTRLEISDDDAPAPDEDRLHQTLQDLSSPEPVPIDLGPISLCQYSDRLVAAIDNVSDAQRWLLRLPVFKDNNADLDIEDYDFQPRAQNVLTAALYLVERNRAMVRAKLRLVILPPGAYNVDMELPFHLQVTFDIHILTPEIFEYPSTYLTKRQAKEIYDCQLRLFQFLYPSIQSTVTPGTTVNIPFFLSILGPALPLSSSEVDDAMQPEKLLPNLLPFQKRSVGWLLQREGKTISSHGQVIPNPVASELTFWDPINVGDRTLYLHRVTGEISGSFTPKPPVLGGVLAEEPGLGKTIETISLILLNPASADRNPTVKRWDPEAQLEVSAIKSTLIVTPPALASQWVDEIATHAPSLKVLVYDGWSKLKIPINAKQVEEERQRRIRLDKKAQKASSKARGQAVKKENSQDKENMDRHRPDEEILDWCNYVNQFDVVITTYATLRTDLDVARAAPVRPRREDVVYSNVERPRSPLVMVEWHRLVMDEVQMVGGGKTEDMVSLVPRLSSFAVSGTPARTQVSDLIHVLKFLRVTSHSDCWLRLMKPGFAPQFAKLFQHYSLRTMKSAVKAELTIPHQTRYLVGIDMGRVERHVYDQSLEACLLELGLDARGIAASEGWDVDGVILRSSIRRLRGICTHPQVGQLAERKNDKLNKPGTLKSIEEVLQMMRDQNWRNLMDDWKSKVQGLIQLSQAQAMNATDKHRYQHSLNTLVTAEKEAMALIQEVEAEIAEHRAKGEILKKEAAALRNKRQDVIQIDDEIDPLDKGKQRAVSPSESVSEPDLDDEDTDSEYGGLPKTPAGDEHRHKGNGLQLRLRECRIVVHRIKFLQGDMYHTLGASHSPQEDAAYAGAEAIRKILLKTTEESAIHGMNQLTLDATTGGGSVTQDTLKIPDQLLGKPGLRSADEFDQFHEIVEDVLNEQTLLLWQWRTKIFQLLTQKLVNDGSDNVDGEEYQRTLENQGEAESYLQAYQALLADRREALSSERTTLALHDTREKKLRHTKAAIKAAANDDMPAANLDLQPEDEVLRKELASERKELLKTLDGKAVKTILINLTNIANRIVSDRDPEKIIVKGALTQLRNLIKTQTEALNKLDLDLALFRKAFNQRILYFRQLQEISDSVTELELERSVEETIVASQVEQAELDGKMNTNRARQRYLDHIAKNKDEVIDELEEDCILCRCEFLRGFITQCAHVFCEGCMKAWLQRKDGKGCPVCRVPIDIDNLQRFAVADRSAAPAPGSDKPVNNELPPKSKRMIEYNMIDPAVFKKIQTVEAFGDYGTKIQTLVRHLLYLQEIEPGAKSIVFSAWADSLHIMQRALHENGIGFLRIDAGAGAKSAVKRFKVDPDKTVLLLHGERENAGLNITCASRVFLLESVVHHGFEIQAIARIDRMGQTRPTEVYCYYAEDTVEKNILDLAARRGLSLYTKENSAGTLNVSSFAAETEKTVVEAATKKKDQKGDFITKIDDMLAVLFPHMYEEIEYLVPDESEDIVMGEPDTVATRVPAPRVNAVAGPSRSR